MTTEFKFSDEAVLETLERLHGEYISGGKISLWYAIVICAEQQAVMPDWIVDEVITINDEIQSGHLKNFKEIFPVLTANSAARNRAYKTDKNFMRVMRLVIEAKKRGEGIDDDLFERIGTELCCSLRQVRDYYKRGKQIETEVKIKSKDWAATSDITTDMWDELDSNNFTIARRRGRTTY